MTTRLPLLALPLALLLALSSLALTSCVSDAAPPTDFLESPLAGKIDGKDWHYKHAYINPTLPTPNEDDLVFVFLPYTPKTPCPKDDGANADSRRILVAAPKDGKLVKIKAGTPRNLTFQYTTKKGSPFVTSAKAGKLKLTQIDDDEVRGKLYALTNDGYWVSGTFTATVCNSMDFR